MNAVYSNDVRCLSTVTDIVAGYVSPSRLLLLWGPSMTYSTLVLPFLNQPPSHFTHICIRCYNLHYRCCYASPNTPLPSLEHDMVYGRPLECVSLTSLPRYICVADRRYFTECYSLPLTMRWLVRCNIGRVVLL